MTKLFCVPLACLAALLMTATASAQFVHGVDDAHTLTLLHIDEGDPVQGQDDGINGPDTPSGVGDGSGNYEFFGSTIETRLSLDDDSNFTRPNENHAQWGRRAGFGPIFRPSDDEVNVAPVTVGVSTASALFGDGSDDGQHDGMEVTPNFVDFAQTNESGIWTNVWDGYPSFETQFWFRNDEITVPDPNGILPFENEALIGAASRWEIYATREGEFGLADGSLFLVLFDDNGQAQFTVNENYTLGDWSQVKAGYDANSSTAYLEIDGVEGFTFVNGNFGGPLKNDQAGLHIGGALKNRAFSGWLDEIQVWRTSSIPEPGCLAMVLIGAGIFGLGRKRG
ncbi:hypothetical protein OAS39_12710 [Pirellulales bacterium]|nr:hypothetical protein [Pirellulales bacterium]